MGAATGRFRPPLGLPHLAARALLPLRSHSGPLWHLLALIRGEEHKPGARTGPAPPPCTASEQLQDIQDEEWLIFWTKSAGKTFMVHAAAGGPCRCLWSVLPLEGHVGVRDPCGTLNHVDVYDL